MLERRAILHLPRVIELPLQSLELDLARRVLLQAMSRAAECRVGEADDERSGEEQEELAASVAQVGTRRTMVRQEMASTNELIVSATVSAKTRARGTDLTFLCMHCSNSWQRLVLACQDVAELRSRTASVLARPGCSDWRRRPTSIAGSPVPDQLLRTAHA